MHFYRRESGDTVVKGVDPNMLKWPWFLSGASEMEAFVVPAQAIGQWSTGLRQNAVVLVVFGMGAMWVSRCLERWIFANSIQWLWHLAALGHPAESCLWSNRKYLHNPMREGEPAAARLNQS